MNAAVLSEEASVDGLAGLQRDLAYLRVSGW